MPYKQVMSSIDYWLAARSVRMTHNLGADYMWKAPRGFIFIHCREPEEIKKFVERNDAITVFVKRPGNNQEIYNNHADANVEKYLYDYGPCELRFQTPSRSFPGHSQRSCQTTVRLVRVEFKLFKKETETEGD